MLTDRQLIELVQRADPVQDVDRLPDARRTAVQLLTVAEEKRAMKTMTPRELTSPGAPPRRRLSPAAAFTTALIVVLAAIGSIAYLSRDGDGAPDVADEPAAPITATSSTSASTRGDDAAPPPPGEDGAGSMGSLHSGTLTATGLESIAYFVEHTSIGYLAGGAGGLWRSADGVSWHRSLELPLELPDPGARPVATDVGAVAEFRSRVYAFGTITIDTDTAEPVTERYAWSTADGETWTGERLPEPSVVDAPLGAVAGDTVLLLYAGGNDCTNPGTELVLSNDGATWRTVVPGEAGLEGIALTDVQAAEEGFVALGSTCGAALSDDYPNGRRTVYRSADGAEWSPLPGVPFTGNEFPEYAAVVDDGTIYAAGVVFDGEQRAALWRSTDGSGSFESVALPAEVYESWSLVRGMVSTSRELVVIVWLGPREDLQRTVLLAGADASALTVVNDPAGMLIDAYPHSVAANANGIVVVGEQRDGFHAWSLAAD